MHNNKRKINTHHSRFTILVLFFSSDVVLHCICKNKNHIVCKFLYVYIQYLTYLNIIIILKELLPDGIASTHSNPLGNWSVLFQFFSKLSLDNKCFVSRLKHTTEFGYV